MKKFSKVLLIFALVSVVLLGVLVSCETPEEYDFAAWQADSLDYEVSLVSAEGKALADQLGDGKKLGTIAKTGDIAGSAVWNAFSALVKADGTDIVALKGSKLDILEIAGVKEAKFTADLEDALKDLLVAAGFESATTAGEYNETVKVEDAFALEVVVKVGFMDATKEVTLKYYYEKATE